MNNAVISEFHPKGQNCKPARQLLHERIFAVIRRALTTISERAAEARRAQRTFEELNAMSDHELEDIGIARADIPAIVAGTYGGMRPVACKVIPLDHRCRTQGLRAAAASPKKPSAA